MISPGVVSKSKTQILSPTTEEVNDVPATNKPSGLAGNIQALKDKINKGQVPIGVMPSAAPQPLQAKQKTEADIRWEGLER